MKILYVTGLPDPVKDIWNGKLENEITHSPQFFHPWHKLVQRGHQVDFVVASNFNIMPNIKVDWFSEENMYANVYDPYLEVPWYRRFFRRAKRFMKLLYYTNKAISENGYDFVYCKAFYEGFAGNIVANLRGVPCGVRSMGTMLYHDFEKYGVIGTALRRPVEYLTFKLKKEFFIMTDDGTKGDIVYEKWRPKRKKYEYCFWKTGVDMKTVDSIHSDIELPKHDYIFFAARVDNWKRHDRIIEILHNLHLDGVRIHLYFAGTVQSRAFYKTIEQLISKYDLDGYVHFLGSVKQDDVKLYAYHAIANPLMYDMSNLGNVFFEIFSAGSVVIGLNDGSLDEYLEHEVNGFIVDDEEAACSVIKQLLRDKSMIQQIRTNAIETSKEKVLSIDDRFDQEVDLIEKVVSSYQR